MPTARVGTEVPFPQIRAFLYHLEPKFDASDFARFFFDFLPKGAHAIEVSFWP